MSKLTLRKLKKALRASRMRRISPATSLERGFEFEPLEQRLLLSVVGGVTPTLDLTDRLNGASDGDPALEVAPTLNGGIFTNDIDIAVFGSGTGLINPFVQVSGGGGVDEHEAYNTSGKNPPPQMGSSGNFNHDLPLSEVPIVYVNDIAYREFRLDINENDTNLERWLSFDDLQIWQSDTAELDEDNVFVPAGADADQTSYGPSTIGFTTGTVDGNYLVYNLDEGDDTIWIAMNYTLNEGSGVSDLVILIPDASFDPTLDYVYVYSAFGYQEGTSDIEWDKNGDFINDETLTDVEWKQGNGFEEWAVRKFALKSGYKFHDLNANGVWDTGEPALEGWTIYIDDNDNDQFDTGEMSAITDSNGFYQFSLFEEAKGQGKTYIFREVLEPGWFQSAPSGGEYIETMKLGDISENNNFGNYQQATKSGYKWHDLDADGVWDAGEPGLEGWTIEAYEGATLVDSTTTDSSGYYEFSLVPGTYTFAEVLQTDWYQSYPTSPNTHTETIISQGVYEDNNFGNYQYATKSGIKYEDVNRSNDYESGTDNLLDGWTIVAFKDNGTVAGELDNGDTWVADVVTVSGAYSFSLKPGDYIIVEKVSDQPANWFESPDAGTSLVNATTNADYNSTYGQYGYAITLTSGQVDADNDFGNYRVLATRTPGFWQTHLELAEDVLPDLLADLGGLIYLGTANGPFSSIEQVMGAFWSSPSDRSPLCKAKYQVVFQAMAALLTSATPGGASIEGSGYSLAQIQTILSSGSLGQIKTLHKALSAFNMSGDDLDLEISQGNATPEDAQNIADIDFWNCQL